MYVALMASWAGDERLELAERFLAPAFDLARRATGLELKQVAGLMRLDESQLRRQLAGVETFDLLRLVRGALDGGEMGEAFLGEFAGALVELAGGMRPLMVRALTCVLEPFVPRLPGRARMVRATLSAARGKEASVA